MKKLMLLLPIFLLAGCEYTYRYPCQDPANWGKEECNNEVCRAEGECTDIVLGRSPLVNFDTSENDISKEKSYSDDCARQEDDFEEIAYKPNRLDEKVFAKKDIRHKKENEYSQESFYREPLTLQEEPLTLDTVVSTDEHNLAAG